MPNLTCYTRIGVKIKTVATIILIYCAISLLCFGRILPVLIFG